MCGRSRDCLGATRSLTSNHLMKSQAIRRQEWECAAPSMIGERPGVFCYRWSRARPRLLPLRSNSARYPNAPAPTWGYPCKRGRSTMGQETILDIDARNAAQQPPHSAIAGSTFWTCARRRPSFLCRHVRRSPQLLLLLRAMGIETGPALSSWACRCGSSSPVSGHVIAGARGEALVIIRREKRPECLRPRPERPPTAPARRKQGLVTYSPGVSAARRSAVASYGQARGKLPGPGHAPPDPCRPRYGRIG